MFNTWLVSRFVRILAAKDASNGMHLNRHLMGSAKPPSIWLQIKSHLKSCTLCCCCCQLTGGQGKPQLLVPCSSWGLPGTATWTPRPLPHASFQPGAQLWGAAMQNGSGWLLCFSVPAPHQRGHMERPGREQGLERGTHLLLPSPAELNTPCSSFVQPASWSKAGVALGFPLPQG